MDSGEVFALIAAERRRAADMFDGLRDEQWAAQSLYAEWTVRDVAALDENSQRNLAGHVQPHRL